MRRHFTLGLEKGREAPSLVVDLFGARAARILGALSPASVSDYLSGLLIGAEVAALRERYRATHITLVGEPALNERYRRAMAAHGVTVNSCRGDEAFLRGIARIIHEHV
ncbi:2-keto-3-deoxy-galactonokinase [Raoultella ornithinolytica]|nr:2-keto-3-deoxy-galactonokinase [Raoultella ornithinolytica]